MKFITHLLSPIIIVVSAITLVAIFSTQPQTVRAASGKDFNPGHIIDDAVFYNEGSMSSSQIQKFLDSKNPNCDYNGTQPASDWGYPNITHAQLAEYKRNGTNGFSKDTGFHAPPYKCLTKYTQTTPQMEAASGYCGAVDAGSRTAAQIINDIAKACGINPQVLIVLLEKEQSLVTDSWPLNRQLRNATGFACPDTAPCNPAYEGFFYQVYYAARQFKVYQAFPNSYNYSAGRTNRIYWHPDLTRCGSSQVYIENQATAALYIYTPYRPNQAALNNLYGTGDSCSSYGNRNFWRIFTDWFGSTRYTTRGGIGIKHVQLGGSSSNIGAPTSNERCGLVQSGCLQVFEKGVIYWTKATDAHALWGGILDRWEATRAENGFLGYPTSGENKITDGVYQQFQNGRIYWKSGTGAWSVHGGIGERYLEIGAEKSTLGFPVSGETCGLSSNGCGQEFEYGKIVWSPASKAWEITGKNHARWVETRAENGFLGYPTSGENKITDGVYQQFQNGRIYSATNSDSSYSVHGGIGEKYITLDADAGSLGLPTSNEICYQSGRCEQNYQNGKIVWGSGAGAWQVRPAILDRWEATRAENGFLGYPTSGENKITDGVYQQFQNGRIYWKSGTGAWSVHGGIGERYLEIGAEKSTLGFPVSGETTDAKTGVVHQKFEKGTIYWSKKNGVWI